MFPAPVAASPLDLEVFSTAPSLDQLPVGETVTFGVQLNGLSPGEELDFLAATLEYDDALLGPATVSPGGIVPNASDFSGFGGPGLADGSFFTFSGASADHITADGVFYTFDVDVLAEGAGVMEVTFADGTFFNLETHPLAMLNVDWQGNISTFSPELLGQHTEEYGTFNFGHVDRGSLFELTQSEAFRRVHADVREGNRFCAETCPYWTVCGGASPSNKYYENGSFASAETQHCRSMIQMPLEIVLQSLEAQAP